MPHLTTTGTQLAATGPDMLGFGVPGYAPHCSPVEWAELTRPDPHCLEAAGRLRKAR